MPSNIAKRSASGKINKPVSRKVYNRYKQRNRRRPERILEINARRRELSYTHRGILSVVQEARSIGNDSDSQHQLSTDSRTMHRFKICEM